MRINHKTMFICLIALGLGLSLARAQNAGVSSGYPTPNDGLNTVEQRGHGLYLRYCYGCHGLHGDGNGENASFLDPKPRDFTLGVFKCRSTPTGTLPVDSDLLHTMERGVWTSGMPSWRPLSEANRKELLAYIKIFSSRWKAEKPGTPIQIPPETAITIESIRHGGELYHKHDCWKCHGEQGRGDGPSASTLTDNKDQPIRPYDFADADDSSRFKCGETNEDLYRIFMTGLDGTPMPSHADVIQPNDAWDIVHFVRTLQTQRHSKELEVLKAAGGKIATKSAVNTQTSALSSDNKPGKSRN
jgi:cytochrome c oxidase cbb3-type subunit I/II